MSQVNCLRSISALKHIYALTKIEESTNSHCHTLPCRQPGEGAGAQLAASRATRATVQGAARSLRPHAHAVRQQGVSGIDALDSTPRAAVRAPPAGRPIAHAAWQQGPQFSRKGHGCRPHKLSWSQCCMGLVTGRLEPSRVAQVPDESVVGAWQQCPDLFYHERPVATVP